MTIEVFYIVWSLISWQEGVVRVLKARDTAPTVPGCPSTVIVPREFYPIRNKILFPNSLVLVSEEAAMRAITA